MTRPNMAKIYLIRHGQAAAGFTSDPDPGLDQIGQSQAEAAADLLMAHTPLTLLSSPLKRAQETAQPLASRLAQSVGIEPRVAEVPSVGLSLEERGPWLQQVMQGQWPDQSEVLQQWQRDMATCLLECQASTAIFTHFVAINAMVAFATSNSNVLVCRPNNGSITVFETIDDQLRLIERGEDASTHVN